MADASEKGRGFLKQEKIDGKLWDVFVKESGKFWCAPEPESPGYYDSNSTLEADSLKKLLEKAREHARKVGRMSIEVTELNTSSWGRRRGEEELQDAVITGIHAGNNNVLYKRVGETGTQQGSYGGTFLRRLTPEEHEEHKRLRKEEAQAEARREAWEQARIVDIRATMAAGKVVLKAPPAPDPEGDDADLEED